MNKFTFLRFCAFLPTRFLNAASCFFLPRLEGSGNDLIPCEAFLLSGKFKFFTCVWLEKNAILMGKYSSEVIHQMLQFVIEI